jgi:hypothetical protein
LDATQFVSDDELKNLSLRAGRSATPANSEEQVMKSKFQVDWRMRLELGSEEETISTPRTYAPEVSSLGFITTQEPLAEVPKGTSKWRVIGMKPAIKTAKKRTKSDKITAKGIGARNVDKKNS